MEVTDSVSIEDILECAVFTANTIGSYALRNISRKRAFVRTFKHDVKLELDIECQAEAEKIIKSKFPDHIIIGEEDTASNKSYDKDSEFQWIIDPIDGTVNFSHGLPFWCCSIAVRKHDKIIIGVVFVPELGELYTATVESTAMRNGTVIQVSSVKDIVSSMILTGLDKDIDPDLPHFALFEKIALNSQKTRILGAAALDLCRVASGQADGYFESGIYIWDIAAASLIIERAGGKSEIFKYQDNGKLMFLATNGCIQHELKKLLNEAL